MDVLLVGLTSTAICFGLLWMVQRFFRVLPFRLNTPFANACVLWLVLTFIVASSWIEMLDSMLESEKWSIWFWENLLKLSFKSCWTVFIAWLGWKTLRHYIFPVTRNDEVAISFALSERVKQMASDPARKIEAIQAYREESGLGLGEAKAAVEAYLSSVPYHE